MADPTPHDDALALDPGFLSARREALIIFLAWVACLAWSVPACYLFGYGSDAPPTTLLGIPTWVFWGIAFPWLLADAFTLWMCMRYMGDDPEPDEDTGAGGADR